jgi:ABC-2 type transport system permease protein
MKFNYYGFKAIYFHEMNRFYRTVGQSLLSPVISTSLYFVVFGSVIGGYIQKIDGVSYGSYIVPGLLMLTLLTQAISNTSFGIFFPKFNGTINEILAAPISTLETVLAFVGAGATKTLIVGAVIYATASFGVVSKNFEQMSIIPSLVITPMVFLGGSLYSLDMLPPFWQTVSYFNPVVYLIDGLRFSFYGISDFNIWISVGSMVSFLVICVIAVSILLKKGYNIKS